jgi:hypothetical protein
LLLEFEDEFALLLLELFDDEFDDELFELLLPLLLELLLLELLELLDELLLELFDSQAILNAPAASAAFAGAAAPVLAGILACADPAASAPATSIVNLDFIILSIHDCPVPESGSVQRTGDLGKIAISKRGPSSRNRSTSLCRLPCYGYGGQPLNRL